jgi:hypothetical protein
MPLKRGDDKGQWQPEAVRHGLEKLNLAGECSGRRTLMFYFVAMNPEIPN